MTPDSSRALLSSRSLIWRGVTNSHFYGTTTVRAHINIRSYPQVTKSSNIPPRISAHLHTPPQFLIGCWKDDGAGNGGGGEGHQETGSEVTSRAMLKVDVTSFPPVPPHLLRIPAFLVSSVHTS